MSKMNLIQSWRYLRSSGFRVSTWLIFKAVVIHGIRFTKEQ